MHNHFQLKFKISHGDEMQGPTFH
uniref:Uncharacterized protein n=1 Tax=Anguilla anguilla TaxID=7936 RepID=A0A0E9WBL1_ANGAN